MVKTDMKPIEVSFMLRPDVRNQFFWRYPERFCAKHDRGTVSVIRANIDTSMARLLLIANPDIGLNILKHVA